MLNPKQEQYVLRYLSLIDMKRVQDSIAKMRETEDVYLKEALFRDAVVSYIKPYSDNRGENQKRGLRINQNGIPDNLKCAHKELVDMRNKICAHNDLQYQQPSFGPGVSFSVKGYKKVFCGHLVEPLLQLSKIMHGHLMKEMYELESHVL